MMARAPFTVPPELRRLRLAWAVIGIATARSRRMTADCPVLTEEPQQDGTWMMTGRAADGAGVSIHLRADTLVVLRYGDAPDMATIPLPPPLCRVTPAITAPDCGARP